MPGKFRKSFQRSTVVCLIEGGSNKMHQGGNYQGFLKWGGEGCFGHSLIINEIEGFFPKVCNLNLI